GHSVDSSSQYSVKQYAASQRPCCDAFHSIHPQRTWEESPFRRTFFPRSETAPERTAHLLLFRTRLHNSTTFIYNSRQGELSCLLVHASSRPKAPCATSSVTARGRPPSPARDAPTGSSGSGRRGTDSAPASDCCRD